MKKLRRREGAEEQLREKERRQYEDERREVESQRQMELFQGLLTGKENLQNGGQRKTEM